MKTEFPGGSVGKVLAVVAFLLVLPLSVAGLYVGSQLMSDPTGAAIGFPLAWLETTPFTDWTYTGRFLFVAIGIVPALSALAILVVPRRAPPLVFFSGAATVLWMFFQIGWTGWVTWLQPAGWLASAAIAGVGWVWWMRAYGPGPMAHLAKIPQHVEELHIHG
jgi:hypothetical protein